jgi:hypothetical protein
LFKEETNDNWTEFNDINKLIFRRPIATDYRIALPYVFNNNPRSIAFQVAQFPLSCSILDPDDASIMETIPFAVNNTYNPNVHTQGQVGFDYAMAIRQVFRAKAESNITFLRHFAYAQNTNQIDYLEETLATAPQLATTTSTTTTAIDHNKISTAKAVLERFESVLEAPELIVSDENTNAYGPIHYDFLTPSFSHYYSDSLAYYPSEFMVTTANRSPYYSMSNYKVEQLNLLNDNVHCGVKNHAWNPSNYSKNKSIS